MQQYRLGHVSGTLLMSVALAALATAAPTQVREWVVSMNSFNGSADSIQSQIAGMYSTAGLMSAESRVEMLQIGDFTAMVVPAGDQDLRGQLNDMDEVQTVQSPLSFGLFETETNAPPTLARLSVRDRANTVQGNNNVFDFPADGGNGVMAYIIDTGVDVNQPVFGGRAQIKDLTGEGAFDGNGHGTHVAGTMAGDQFGIARKASIMSIKVFDSSGKGSGTSILRAMQEVSKEAKANKMPGVLNMSLGGNKSGGKEDVATARAVEALTKQGIAVVVAAGNEAQDACNVSPAFSPNAITVSAIDGTDKLASFSNFGKCTDIAAPGVKVQSAKVGGGVKVLSGTSMASPHVAGVMAVFMSQGLSVEEAQRELLRTSTTDAIQGNTKGSANRILFLPAPENTGGNNGGGSVGGIGGVGNIGSGNVIDNGNIGGGNNNNVINNGGGGGVGGGGGTIVNGGETGGTNSAIGNSGGGGGGEQLQQQEQQAQNQGSVVIIANEPSPAAGTPPTVVMV